MNDDKHIKPDGSAVIQVGKCKMARVSYEAIGELHLAGELDLTKLVTGRFP